MEFMITFILLKKKNDYSHDIPNSVLSSWKRMYYLLKHVLWDLICNHLKLFQLEDGGCMFFIGETAWSVYEEKKAFGLKTRP